MERATRGVPTYRPKLIFAFLALAAAVSFLWACSPGGDYGIDLYFVPETQFLEIEENYQPPNYGFFWAYWQPTGRLHHANVLISSVIKQAHRNHFIREEITQSLGLMNDSPRYPDSIFFAGPTTTETYTQLDMRIIEMLYVQEVKTNQSPEQVRGSLTGPYSQEELGYFFEIALNTEYGGNDAAIRKWSGELPIRIHGAPTQADIETLNQVIAELNQLTEVLEIYIETPH